MTDETPLTAPVDNESANVQTTTTAPTNSNTNTNAGGILTADIPASTAATAATQGDEDVNARKVVVKKVVPPVMPMDWTNLGVSADESIPLRYPHDVAELTAEDLDICVVGTAGQKITQMPPDFSSLCNPKLETLVLRSHLLTKMQGLEHFTHMDTLELYDNQIQALESLEGPGPNLRVLDMSYNSIRDMMPVSLCPNLQELYLANNKVKSMEGLSALVQLKKVDLGANRIRVMDPKELAPLVNLEELWIGKNKIEEITGLETLVKLRRLDVQSNRLTKVENLTTQIDTLEELFLAHNGIDDEGASCETGLALTFTKLNVVDLSRNRLTSTKPFAHLPAVEELWLSGNQMQTLEAARPLQEAASLGIQSLETVYLEYNPLASDFEYRKTLKEWIPNLTQIDATMIGGFPSHIAGTTGLVGRIGASIMTPAQLQQAALDRARQQENQTSTEQTTSTEGKEE